MQPSDLVPQEGGVTIVFDVRQADVPGAIAVVSAARFDVRRYYHHDDEHAPGGSPLGSVRLGAGRPMKTFTDVERDQIVADFDHARLTANLGCTVIGVDEWTSGGGPDLGGVREPRTPSPDVPSGSAHYVPGSLMRNWGRRTYLEV